MKILVLEAAGLHAGYLGCYGNDWVATPNLDRLAADGIVFDQHIADEPDPDGTIPLAQRSVATGRYRWPTTFDAVPNREENTLSGGIRCLRATATLARFDDDVIAALKRWRTAECPVLWVEGPDLTPPWRLPADLLGMYLDEDDPDAAPWSRPPLGRHDFPLDDLRRLQDTYAAVVTYWDARLGDLLDRDELGRVVLCVTARAGLPLGEHGLNGPARPWLHDEMVHVPLLWRMPNAADAGLRIGALTQPVDLLPTFGDLLGVPVPDVHGHSLMPLIRRDEVEAVRPYACSILRLGGAEEWLLRTPDWAFLLPVAMPEDEPRAPQLYVKPDDRWEVNDLYPRHPGVADDLEKTLRAFAEAVRQPGPFVLPPLPEAEAAGKGTA